MTDPARTPGWFVGICIGSYDNESYEPLPRAVPDATDLSQELEGRGFTVRLLQDLSRNEINDRLRELLPPGEGPKVVVVMWSGHGLAVGNSLRLLPRDAPLVVADDDTYRPGTLAERALNAGADQVLLLLDTCYSGQGVVDALTAAQQFESVRSSVEGRGRWLGVVASCQSYQKALDGAFGEALLRLLKSGPSSPAYQAHWSAHNEGVRGIDLIEALKEEWPSGRQVPWQGAYGHSRPMLPNPKFDPAASQRLVAHLVMSSRGLAPDEEGWYFSGRHRVLRQIVDWLLEGTPGLFIVTGPAGSGKSAVVGRIAALSDPVERAEIVAHNALDRNDPDPGERSIDIRVYARGQTYESLLAEIAQELGLAPDITSPYPVLERLAWRRPRVKIVIDALDEVNQTDLERIVVDLLPLVAREALVLVGTRERSLSGGRG